MATRKATIEHHAPVTLLHPSPQEVFCGRCVFYAPFQSSHRCRHAQAVQVVKTFAGLALRQLEPEDKNAQNDCADFQARTWGDAVRRLVFLLAGVTFLWALLFYVVPSFVGR